MTGGIYERKSDSSVALKLKNRYDRLIKVPCQICHRPDEASELWLRVPLPLFLPPVWDSLVLMCLVALPVDISMA